MKMMLIKWLLPLVMDLILQAISTMARKSDNTIDDAIVAKFAENKDSLVSEIKRSL